MMDTSSGVEQTGVPSSTEKTHTKAGRNVAWGITVISAVSLILTLLGYGVTLAVEIEFGVPHETVYSSVLDLIGLSAYAILSMILGIGKVKWQPLVELVWMPSIGVAGGLFILISVLVWLRAYKPRIVTRTALLRGYFHLPTPHDSSRQLLGKGAIGSGLFGVLFWISPFFIVAALMVTMVLISIIPIFGMQMGNYYLHEFVVQPAKCVPVRPRTALLQAWSVRRKNETSQASAASCVDLVKDGKRVASGRVVVSTTTVILLFDPDSGATRRVPISELTVQAVDTVKPVVIPS